MSMRTSLHLCLLVLQLHRACVHAHCAYHACTQLVHTLTNACTQVGFTTLSCRLPPYSTLPHPSCQTTFEPVRAPLPTCPCTEPFSGITGSTVLHLPGKGLVTLSAQTWCHPCGVTAVCQLLAAVRLGHFCVQPRTVEDTL